MTEPALPTDSKTAPRRDGLPKRGATARADDRPPLELARRIVELAEDKKAADIILLDLAGQTTMADYFVPGEGPTYKSSQLSLWRTGYFSAG